MTGLFIPHQNAEKKGSRRFTLVPVQPVEGEDEFPIRDIYVLRPFSNGKDKLILTIDEA